MTIIGGDEDLIIGGDKAYLVPPNIFIGGDLSPLSPWELRRWSRRCQNQVQYQDQMLGTQCCVYTVD